jgi:NADP-dependent 3-hydroxy acid dehydrogenase YdfG
MADPVFLITGASSGIGEATARRAAEAGFRVVLAARRAELLEQLAEELGGAERALAIRCDVTEWADQQLLAETALSRFGRIDVAFANAGFGATRGFLEETPEHWKSIEPGTVDTPFFDSAVEDALEPDDIARAVMFAVEQPPHVDVNELLVRPTSQEN